MLFLYKFNYEFCMPELNLDLSLFKQLMIGAINNGYY